MNLFNLKFPHMGIWGTTGTGKTFKFMNDFEKCGLGGFHINYTRIPSPFVKVNGDYEIDDLLKAVKAGEKLNYHPALDKKRAKKEVDYIIYKIFESELYSENEPCVFALDECHILAREGERNNQVELVATTGRAFGLKGVFISQRPSMVSKVLVTQAEIHAMFTLSDFDRAYFKDKGIDFDGIQSRVRSSNIAEKSHKYCIWQNGLINGPFEEKI